MLIPTKEPAVLPTIAFAPSVQRSTQRKMSITAWYYHEDSIDLMNLFKMCQRIRVLCGPHFERSLQSKRAATIKLQTFVAFRSFRPKMAIPSAYGTTGIFKNNNTYTILIISNSTYIGVLS